MVPPILYQTLADTDLLKREERPFLAYKKDSYSNKRLIGFFRKTGKSPSPKAPLSRVLLLGLTPYFASSPNRWDGPTPTFWPVSLAIL